MLSICKKSAMLFVNRQYKFNKLWALDVMIIRMFTIVFILALILFYIQWNIRPICNAIGIYIINSKKIFLPGEAIFFNIKGGRTSSLYSWEFGDKQTSSGQQVYHIYYQPGTFFVSVVAGHCKWYKTITIRAAIPPALPKIKEEIFPIIEGPATTYAGKLNKYFNNTPRASSWSWHLADKPNEKYTQSYVMLSFKEPGDQILSLIINNDSSHMVTKQILVLPVRTGSPDIKPTKPADVAILTVNPAPTKKIPIAITADEFKYLLQQVANQTIKSSYLLSYCCDTTTNVIINGKESIDFHTFCNRIIGKRKIQIEELNINKSPDGCITEIIVSSSRKKILGIF